MTESVLSLEKRVGALFSEQIDTKKISIKRVARVISQELGVSQGLLERHASHIKKGRILGTTSARPRYIDRLLHRLSVLLYAVGVDENLPEIEDLKQYYDNFNYPPFAGISYDAIKEKINE